MSNAFFSDLLSSITDRGRNLLGLKGWPVDPAQRASSLIELCHALLSGRGEASGTAIAREVLDRYSELDGEGRVTFFKALAKEFGPDRARLDKAMKDWSAKPSDDLAAELHFISEPRRQELFRRLNRAPGGTRALVAMRADLLDLKHRHADIAAVDRDFGHLLNSWFNRGFLVLRHINWSTRAIVLEKIIRYEAVHQIKGWEDLRRRIDPADRRCYAFFHPALVDEPLIFVEVALTQDIPGAISPLLAEDRTPVALEQARTAVFYSISNCQRGLAGISFGSFLIKQVVEELRRELPKLDCFVTLSPVPGFSKWVASAADVSDEDKAGVVEMAGLPDAERTEELRKTLEPLAARYFLKAKADKGRPFDAVARFHLGNGARLERINWLGDTSVKGLKESAGLMVNYRYELDDIEKNHEAFANQGEIVAASGVRKLLKGEGRSRFSRVAQLNGEA